MAPQRCAAIFCLPTLAFSVISMGIVPTIETEGFLSMKEELDALLTTDSEMEKRLRRAISRALSRARSSMEKEVFASLTSDPRRASKAVKKAVYKRILGGSVSILNRNRRGSMQLIEPERKFRDGHRGGNRVPRSKRTEELLSYYGEDRAFILRFNNSGTTSRTSRYGNRGSIAPKNMLQANAGVMDMAVDELAQYIEEEYNKILKNG